LRCRLRAEGRCLCLRRARNRLTGGLQLVETCLKLRLIRIAPTAGCDGQRETSGEKSQRFHSFKFSASRAAYSKPTRESRWSRRGSPLVCPPRACSRL